MVFRRPFGYPEAPKALVLSTAFPPLGLLSPGQIYKRVAVPQKQGLLFKARRSPNGDMRSLQNPRNRIVRQRHPDLSRLRDGRPPTSSDKSGLRLALRWMERAATFRKNLLNNHSPEVCALKMELLTLWTQACSRLSDRSSAMLATRSNPPSEGFNQAFVEAEAARFEAEEAALKYKQHCDEHGC